MGGGKAKTKNPPSPRRSGTNLKGDENLYFGYWCTVGATTMGAKRKNGN
jgi:hypothetical protein